VAITVTSATERDRARRARILFRPGRREGLLAGTSLVAILAIGLAFAGRMQTADRLHQSPIDLNAVASSSELEPALAAAFTDAADRRVAALHLYGYIQSVRDAGSELRNVGTLLRATAPAEAVRRGGPAYRERLRQIAERTESPGGGILPVFTADDLAAVKPALVVRTPRTFASLTWRWGALYLLAIWTVAGVWWWRRIEGDYALLSAAHLLTAIGFALALSRPDPLRDGLLFVRYTQGVALGCVAYALASLVDFRRTALASFSYVPLAGALFLSLLLLVFGSGPGGSQAKVNLGPVQPIEAIRLLLALFLAGYFARRWELLRQVRSRSIRGVDVPRWLHLPRLDYALPVLACVAAALLFFFAQKDLGPALLVACMFLTTYAVARGRVALAAVGTVGLAAGFYVGHVLNVSTIVSARVQMWRSAWDNAARGGDQIAQAIWAVSTGGITGTGLGLGDLRYVPAGHTDLVLAAAGEELGFLGMLTVAGLFVVIAARGVATARQACSDYGFFLATLLTLSLVLPALIMSAGTVGLVPLTGIVTPFLSYGGSAMVANFTTLGLLTAIRRAEGPAGLTAPFQRGLTSLSAVLGLSALVVTGVLLRVQVLAADTYVVRPHLGLQADGVRRYQYNQRLLDTAQQLGRGTIYDRNGLPLATSDAGVAGRGSAEYRKRGVDPAPCRADEERCYPLAGAAFHLLGDAASRVNWSASNTSYAERDLQNRLRGFDDRASVVRTTDASGRPASALRRDYGELLPLLRHRYQPDHPDVQAVLARTRDVTLTVDAAFQARVAAILERYASRSATGRAAAVVMEPRTGDVLALVSYPYPGARAEQSDSTLDADALLDRARYGLYPPGSTFKLVTAAAALRLDPETRNNTFMCTHQPNGRVGARLPGYGVVRDDVLDTHPHGKIAMRDALVRSCNAYFAQLAVGIGARRFLDTAALVGVSVAHDDSAARLNAALPHAAYGQGDVVASPLRMARVAAAIAAGGMLPEPRIDRESRPGTPVRLLSPEAAGLLGRYLRQAVTEGTGRSLEAHRWRIAGKTGTAEVAGAASHSWFVGFAPHGDAERSIAFAVLVENAGYGGSAAAPAAGEIVTAAAARGLVR
jgi:cell division protein FtsW (lipid II flippase)